MNLRPAMFIMACHELCKLREIGDLLQSLRRHGREKLLCNSLGKEE
jgi:hypothetical protein